MTDTTIANYSPFPDSPTIPMDIIDLWHIRHEELNSLKDLIEPLKTLMSLNLIRSIPGVGFISEVRNVSVAELSRKVVKVKDIYVVVFQPAKEKLAL